MPFGDLYERQVRLLIRTLPFVLVETEFALKAARPSICSSATCRASPSKSI